MTRAFLLTIILGACTYDERFFECTVRCDDDSGCPESLVCGNEGLCRSLGAIQTCSVVLGVQPSCAGLAARCGPANNEDCCSPAMPIPGGTFYRSYDMSGDGMYSNMSYLATVSPFMLDRFEVTVGRFRKFVEAGQGTRANTPPNSVGMRRLNGLDGQGGWDASWNTLLAADTTALIATVKCDGDKQTWTDAAGANEALPINCVTWYEAFAFCTWDGGYLPTEAEWNFAAAGGDEQRAYPWSKPTASTAIDCTHANYRNGAYCVNPPNGATSHVGSTSPKGDGHWGQADLGGNVFNWTLDWYAPPYPQNPCVDCANLTPAAYRVLRGGSFSDVAALLRVGSRGAVDASGRANFAGIRCARNAL